MTVEERIKQIKERHTQNFKRREERLENVYEDRAFLLGLVKRQREVMSRKILGKSLEQYLHEQFPATRGHIPINEWIAGIDNALAFNPEDSQQPTTKGDAA